MDSSVVEEQPASELQEIKDQLNIQKCIYGNLSQKMKDLEFQIEAMNQELITSKEELVKQKKDSAELRDSLINLNTQCTHFFSKYQDKLESFDLELSWLYLGYSENDNKPSPQKSFLASRQVSTRVPLFTTIQEETESDKEN